MNLIDKLLDSFQECIKLSAAVASSSSIETSKHIIALGLIIQFIMPSNQMWKVSAFKCHSRAHYFTVNGALYWIEYLFIANFSLWTETDRAHNKK